METANMYFYYKNSDLAHDFQFKIDRLKNWGKESVHSHEYFQIWYVLSGECIHHCNDKIYELKKGDIFILPPGVFHAMIPNETSELIRFDFSKEFVVDSTIKTASVINDADTNLFTILAYEIKPRVSLSFLDSQSVKVLLEECIEEYIKKNAYYDLFVKGNLYKILAIIFRGYKEIVVEDKKNLKKYEGYIRTTIEYMERNFKNRISVDEISKAVAMSKSQFSNVFKHITGKTFVEYLNNLRINEAKKLIMEGRLTIGGIACELGFSDMAYFNKVFKKIVGISPMSYKQKNN